jgi:hypothetical protein
MGFYPDFSVAIQHPLYGPQAPGSASITAREKQGKAGNPYYKILRAGPGRSLLLPHFLFLPSDELFSSSVEIPPWTSVIYPMARSVSLGSTEGEIIALVMKI